MTEQTFPEYTAQYRWSTRDFSALAELVVIIILSVDYCVTSDTLFKPPPPVGAGGGYMFSGRPSVPLSVRPCVRPSVRPSVRP